MFVLSDYQTIYTKRVYTILDFLSGIGGLFGLIFSAIAVVGVYINSEEVIKKLLYSMFWYKTSATAKELGIGIKDFTS